MNRLFLIVTFLILFAPAKANLSKDEAQGEATRIWKDYSQRMRDHLHSDFNANQVQLANHQMRYALKIFGDRPVDGRSLFISLHGGGNAAKARNDEQWENQKIMFSPSEGVYVSPRAPSDSWDMWSKSYVDKLILKLIKTLILFEGVDPRREGQTIEVESSRAVELEILLNDTMLNLDEAVVVLCSGQEIFRGHVMRTVEHIKSSIDDLGDPSQIFTGRISVLIPQSQLPGLCLAKTLHDRFRSPEASLIFNSPTSSGNPITGPIS